jgi:hypothetical protein
MLRPLSADMLARGLPFCVGLGSLSYLACAGALTPAPSVPDTLRAPMDQAVLLKARARGVQTYECKAAASSQGAFVWALKAPEAVLFDERGEAIGKHYAGPAWELRDGSRVIGEKIAQSDAPEAGAIPWLLLRVRQTEGNGVLTHAQTVQRVATSGGKPPPDGCDAAHAAAEVRVPYTATYYFNGRR